jgi:hypothetical protein
MPPVPVPLEIDPPAPNPLAPPPVPVGNKPPVPVPLLLLPPPLLELHARAATHVPTRTTLKRFPMNHTSSIHAHLKHERDARPPDHRHVYRGRSSLLD